MPKSCIFFEYKAELRKDMGLLQHYLLLCFLLPAAATVPRLLQTKIQTVPAANSMLPRIPSKTLATARLTRPWKLTIEFGWPKTLIMKRPTASAEKWNTLPCTAVVILGTKRRQCALATGACRVRPNGIRWLNLSGIPRRQGRFSRLRIPRATRSATKTVRTITALPRYLAACAFRNVARRIGPLWVREPFSGVSVRSMATSRLPWFCVTKTAPRHCSKITRTPVSVSAAWKIELEKYPVGNSFPL